MKTNRSLSKFCAVFAIATAFTVSAAGAQAAGAHGGGHHGGGKTTSSGMPGKASDVTRTINVEMFDNYYMPKNLTVKSGETVRFVIKNAGDLVHEFNIGRAATHAAHQKEMMAMMESGVLEADKINHAKMGAAAMAHNDPNSVLLEPGKSAEMIWSFAAPSALEFACNVPGHYESGMMGKFKFN